MTEFRCEKCGKLLAKVEMRGIVEIKCPRCKALNRLRSPVTGAEALLLADYGTRANPMTLW